MLHPTESELGRPLEYDRSLWTETAAGTPNGIVPVATGIRLQPASPAGSSAQTQLIHGFNPLLGTMIIAAARILLEGVEACDFFASGYGYRTRTYSIRKTHSRRAS